VELAAYFRYRLSTDVRYRNPSTLVLQQSVTVCGGYASRTSRRFISLSINCVSAPSNTFDFGGSSLGSAATMAFALSMSSFRSSVILVRRLSAIDTEVNTGETSAFDWRDWQTRR
jgi:hypothetical protein